MLTNGRSSLGKGKKSIPSGGNNIYKNADSETIWETFELSVIQFAFVSQFPHLQIEVAIKPILYIYNDQVYVV